MSRMIAAILLILALADYSLAQCHAPHFRVGKDFSSRDDALGSLFISIRARDLTIDKLGCLVQTLSKRHPAWKDAGVLIFDSREAANNFHATYAD